MKKEEEGGVYMTLNTLTFLPLYVFANTLLAAGALSVAYFFDIISFVLHLKMLFRFFLIVLSFLMCSLFPVFFSLFFLIKAGTNNLLYYPSNLVESILTDHLYPLEKTMTKINRMYMIHR